MTKDNSAPAFPVPPSIRDSDGFMILPMNGMSLRQYFAAKALSLGGEFFHNLGNGCNTPETISIAAYQIADAMIAERKKSNPSK